MPTGVITIFSRSAFLCDDDRYETKRGYADDVILCHCKSAAGGAAPLLAIADRFAVCKLQDGAASSQDEDRLLQDVNCLGRLSVAIGQEMAKVS